MGAYIGFAVACFYYPQVATLLSKHISDIAYLNILSCSILFLGIQLLSTGLGIALTLMSTLSFVKWADRLYGAILGTLRALFIASAFLLILIAFLPPKTSFIRQSFISSCISSVSRNMALLASKDIRQKFLLNIEGYDGL